MNKTKVKRKLFNFDFEGNGAHVALVSKDQGGAACGYKVLVTKSTNTGIQPTDPIKVQKALEQVTIKTSMEEFLRKFFSMYSSDAELLTAMLGFQTEYQYSKEQNPDVGSDWYDDWMAERLDKFTIMKSLHEQPNQQISDEDFIAISLLQEKVEKALQQHEESLSMTTVTIEKARLSELEIKENELQVTIEKANGLQARVEELETQIQKAAEDKEAIEFGVFKDTLKDLVAEAELDKVAKSLWAVNKNDKDAAATVIESLKAKKAAVEQSDLFQEETHGENIDAETKRVQAMKAALNEPYKTL